MTHGAGCQDRRIHLKFLAQGVFSSGPSLRCRAWHGPRAPSGSAWPARPAARSWSGVGAWRRRGPSRSRGQAWPSSWCAHSFPLVRWSRAFVSRPKNRALLVGPRRGRRRGRRSVLDAGAGVGSAAHGGGGAGARVHRVRWARAFVSEPKIQVALLGARCSPSLRSSHRLGRWNRWRTGGARRRRRWRSMSVPSVASWLGASVAAHPGRSGPRRAQRASYTWCRSRGGRRRPPVRGPWGARASASGRAIASTRSRS